MPCYLGIDYGLKRIGLAVSDTQGKMAVPLKQLYSAGSPSDDAGKLQEVIDQYGIEAVVIGLPLMENGAEGEQARITRRFGRAVQAQTALPVDYWDERYSSHTAEALLDQRSELTRKKRRARQDAVAAQAILQGYLDDRQGQQAREATD